MEEVEKLTLDLVESINQTVEYKNYQLLLKKIMQDTTLYDKMNEFRKKNLCIQMEGGEDIFEKITALYEEYNNVLSIKEVSDFLSAEINLCKMIKRINTAMMESMELDTAFLL